MNRHLLQSVVRVFALNVLLSVFAPVMAQSQEQADLLKNPKFLNQFGRFASVQEFQGEPALHYEGGEFIAVLDGTEHEDAVIEFEFASEIVTNERTTVIGGIAFRARPVPNNDKVNYDGIVFQGSAREFLKKTGVSRNTIRYSGSGGHWKSLRDFVGKYNAPSENFNTEGWTKVKIVVEGKSMKLYLGNSTTPDFAMDDLKCKNKSGYVGLLAYNNYYRNLRVTPLSKNTEASK